MSLLQIRKQSLVATAADRRQPRTFCLKASWHQVGKTADSNRKQFIFSTCIFCGEINEKFVKEGLELHYFKICPMLRRCTECKQVSKRSHIINNKYGLLYAWTLKVIEIATQTDHLLNECEFHESYKKCPRCLEAVSMQEHDHHFKYKLCTQTTNGLTKCPLCHHSVTISEDAWKDHLMKPNGCTKNPRKSPMNHADMKRRKWNNTL